MLPPRICRSTSLVFESRWFLMVLLIIGLASVHITPLIGQVKIHEKIRITPGPSVPVLAETPHIFNHTIQIYFRSGNPSVAAELSPIVYPMFPGQQESSYTSPGCVRSKRDSSIQNQNTSFMEFVGHGWFSIEPKLYMPKAEDFPCPVWMDIVVDGEHWGPWEDSLRNPSMNEEIPLGSWGQWNITVPNLREIMAPVEGVIGGRPAGLFFGGPWIQDCESWTQWWSPMTEPISLEIISGGEYAWFQNEWDDSWKSNVVNGMISDDLHGVMIGTPRGLPDTTDLSFVLHTSTISFDRMDTVHIFPQDTLFVTFDPPEISPGDTAIIRLQRREEGEVNDFQGKYEIGIIEGAEFGKLLRADQDTSKYFPQEWGFEEMKFVASKNITSDSVKPVIRVGILPSDGQASSVREVTQKPGVWWRGRDMLRRKQNSIKYLPIQKSVRESALEFQYSESGRGTIIIRKKGREILLGETKYYYAIEENNHLKICETTNPDLNPGLNDVIFNDPMRAEGSQKNPVYWEDQSPTYTGNAFTGSKILPAGMIRLIGRYWEEGKGYQATLIATKPSDGKTDSITIEVIKPIVLGDTNITDQLRHSLIEDVKGDSLWLDELLIRYAGKYGIPPQFLKGDIQKESSFLPSFRWEPFFDSWHIQLNGGYAGTSEYFTDSFQYRINSTSDKGTPEIPSDHSNLYDGFGKISAYPGYVGTIWEEFYKYCSVVNPGSSKNLYPQYSSSGDTLWYKYPTRMWDKNFLDTKKSLLKNENMTSDQKNSVARDTANGWLRYKWQNGIMNTGIAQTRIASSYGLMQMMYTTAHGNRNYPIDDEHFPERLNTVDTNFYYAIPYMKMMLDSELGSASDTTGNWNNGFELAFLRTFNRYNGASEEYDVGHRRYGYLVLQYSRTYLKILR